MAVQDGFRKPEGAEPMSAGEFGVATEHCGLGMVVSNKFDTIEEAQAFRRRFVTGGAVICRFSDGRWRPVKFVLVCPAEPSVGAPGNTELRCSDCGGRVHEHRSKPVLA